MGRLRSYSSWTDPEASKLYQERFPNDKVLVADAQNIYWNYKDFDFIWSSPPYPSHSRASIGIVQIMTPQIEGPDLKLYKKFYFCSIYYAKQVNGLLRM
jgi:DNA (cytosine-5)-methyltransferase 1